jgi:hypothetical protein
MKLGLAWPQNGQVKLLDYVEIPDSTSAIKIGVVCWCKDSYQFATVLVKTL